MISMPAPKTLDGNALAAELAAAGVSGTSVVLVGPNVEVRGTDDRATVERVVAAHVPPPPPTDPVADLVAALGPADTVAKIKGALSTHLPRAFGRAR